MNLKIKSGNRWRIVWIATMVAFSCGISGCGGTTNINHEATIPAIPSMVDESSVETTTSEKSNSQEESSGDVTIHVVAVGDNLVQECVYKSAQVHATDGNKYNFDYCYENIKSLICGDLNIINQETLICNGDYEISGSNFNFNAPVELGDALIGVGFDVVTMCNNHLLDKGVGGLNSCMDYWDAKRTANSSLLTYGVYRDYMDMQNVRIKEVQGKTVAFLGYTESTNGYSLPENSELEIVYMSQEDVIETQIQAAKQLADVVIVTCHWGVEDTHTVTDRVKDRANKIINWGADVIVGTHPHVAQSMEYLTRADGTQGFVFYSLGNFISAQTDNFNLVGELADFNIVVKEDGGVAVEKVEVTPIITHYEDGKLSNLRLYLYNQYSEELAAQHGLPATNSGTYRRWNMEEIQSIFDTAVPKQYQKLN